MHYLHALLTQVVNLNPILHIKVDKKFPLEELSHKSLALQQLNHSPRRFHQGKLRFKIKQKTKMIHFADFYKDLLTIRKLQII